MFHIHSDPEHLAAPLKAHVLDLSVNRVDLEFTCWQVCARAFRFARLLCTCMQLSSHSSLLLLLQSKQRKMNLSLKIFKPCIRQYCTCNRKNVVFNALAASERRLVSFSGMEFRMVAEFSLPFSF